MATQKEQALARGLYRKLQILAGLTGVFVASLAIAPAKSYFSEWRQIQHEYGLRAAALSKPPMELGIKQQWRPEVALTDRCVSCHVGMGAAPALQDGGVMFGAHPEVHHDVEKMGCTICHRGQGRATSKEAAHGTVEHWENPMLPKALLQAACGQCHGPAVRSHAADLVEQGAYQFDLQGCASCHGATRGKVRAPDLSGVGVRGYRSDWPVLHAQSPATRSDARTLSFGQLAVEDKHALDAYLDTRVGAPVFTRGKAIAVERGCRGCHRIDGIGGEHGPDLSESATKPGVDRDYSGVVGEHTEENWHRQHLRNPGAVSPGSRMPPQVLSAEDEDALLTFLLAQRTPAVALEHLPKRTIMARVAESRDYDANDGAALYGLFCAACHGADAKGQWVASLGVMTPALDNEDLLSVASDEYLRATIRLGRPGRDMPGWGGEKGGLGETEVRALTAHLRRKLPAPPSFDEVIAELPKADAVAGELVFRDGCSGCHGANGTGTVIAPSLTNAELHAVATPRFLYETIVNGRANTGMPAHRHYNARTLADLIVWLSGQEDTPIVIDGVPLTEWVDVQAKVGAFLSVRSLEAYQAAGSPARGALVFDSLCLGCHGPEGQGGLGPAIGNPAFLRVASDGFLAGSMLLGRGQRAMRPFGPGGLTQLTPDDVGDLIAYLRDVSSHERPIPGLARVQGTVASGKEKFASYCSGCHGAEGVGRTGPALANPGLLAAATDGFLQATIAKGRRGTAMRGWAQGGYGFAELSPEDINDIVAYIRSFQTVEPAKTSSNGGM